MNDPLLFAAGSAVFLLGGAGVILIVLDQLRRADASERRKDSEPLSERAEGA